MRIRDVMTRKVTTVSPEDSVEAARNLMALRKVRHLVVRRNGQVAGTLAERDLDSRFDEGREGPRTVAEVMTTDPLSMAPTGTVRQAANRLRTSADGALVVLEENGTLAGIVTVSDLLRLLGKGLAQPVTRGQRPILARRALRTAPRIARLHA